MGVVCMAIATESYEEVYGQYIAAMTWIERLGLSLNQGRTKFYKDVLLHWKHARWTASLAEAERSFPDFVSSLFEVHDFISIYQAFRDTPDNQLDAIVGKLRKGINGPINAADESPTSTAARNHLFEVVVAAMAHQPHKGITAILDAKSDTGIRVDQKKLWVECKRVTAINGIERNARDASSQLEKTLRAATGSGHRGIVALDVSKVLQKGDQFFVAQNDHQLLTAVDKLLDQFIADHSRIWQRVYERRHRKIIGTIVRFSFMAKSEDRNTLVYTSQWGINPRADISRNDEVIQQQLVGRLTAAE